MRKFFSLILAAALLLGAAASADGILPVLQTPPPEISEAVSYHYYMNLDTPTASSDDSGCYYYTYTASYADYLKFGKALVQDGYALVKSEMADDGTGALIATLEKPGCATLTIRYNQDMHSLKVTYPPSVIAIDADPANPYTIDETQASILPELTQAISLHAVAWFSRPDSNNIDKRSDGGYRYYYSSVPYSAYERFSNKLAEEGFSLVSSDVTDNGYNHAVITNGEYELEIYYHTEKKDIYVHYPAGVHARDRKFYEDYTIVRDGEVIDLDPNIKATIAGWEPVERFYGYRSGKWFESDDTTQVIILKMDVDYRLPTGMDYYYLIEVGSLVAEGEDSKYITYGKLYVEDDGDMNILDYYDDIAGRDHFTLAIGLRLTKEQAANPEGVAISFRGYNNYTPMIYYLKPPAAE